MKRYYSDVREALKDVYMNDLDGSRGMRSRGADRVMATVGYEGTGKSNFALHCLEAWYSCLGKPVDKTLVSQITATPEEFGKCILQAKEFDQIMVDEAVLMSYGRKSMSEGNTAVNQMLMVIRGRHLYLNLLIPNILDLDSYLKKNRLSSLWVMRPNYYVAYFSRERVRKIVGKLYFLSKNGNYADPMKLGIKPNFVAKVPLYNGVLAEEYKKIKENNMQQQIEKVAGILLKKDKTEEKEDRKKRIDVKEKRVMELFSMGMTVPEVAREMGLKSTNIGAITTNLKRRGIDPYKHRTENELKNMLL